MKTTLDINKLKHLKLKFSDNLYIVSLIDRKGYEIIRGFGSSITEAINDLHSSVL